MLPARELRRFYKGTPSPSEFARTVCSPSPLDRLLVPGSDTPVSSVALADGTRYEAKWLLTFQVGRVFIASRIIIVISEGASVTFNLGLRLGQSLICSAEILRCRSGGLETGASCVNCQPENWAATCRDDLV